MPLCSDGIRPERTSDDLPQPDVPIDRQEPVRSEPAQQIVDLFLAAEEEMIFVRLRTAAGPGTDYGGDRSPSLRAPGLSRSSGRDTNGSSASGTSPSHCGMRIASCVRKRSFSGVRGAIRQTPTHGGVPPTRRRPRTFWSSRSFPRSHGSLPAAVEDQRAVTAAEVLVVILANLGFVAVEDRVNDLEVVEQEIGPRRDRVGVALVVDQIEVRRDRRASRSCRQPARTPCPGARPLQPRARSSCAGPRAASRADRRRVPMRGSMRSAIEHLALTRSSSTCRPGGIQTSRENWPLAGPLDRELVLHLDERREPALGHEAVGAADHVNRQPAARQIVADGGLDFARPPAAADDPAARCSRAARGPA